MTFLSDYDIKIYERNKKDGSLENNLEHSKEVCLEIYKELFCFTCHPKYDDIFIILHTNKPSKNYKIKYEKDMIICEGDRDIHVSKDSFFIVNMVLDTWFDDYLRSKLKKQTKNKVKITIKDDLIVIYDDNGNNIKIYKCGKSIIFE